jgi:hypothetical protein
MMVSSRFMVPFRFRSWFSSQAEQALGEGRFDVQSKHNVDLIDQFFQAHKELPVTTANIYQAIRERQNEFIYLTQAQADWRRAAQSNLDLANSLASFLSALAQGQPGQLLNNEENLILLFNELNSRRESATFQTIQNAENRIANRPGRRLQRTAKARPLNLLVRQQRTMMVLPSSEKTWLNAQTVVTAARLQLNRRVIQRLKPLLRRRLTHQNQPDPQMRGRTSQKRI